MGHQFKMVIFEDPWHSQLYIAERIAVELSLRLRSVAARIRTPNLPFAGLSFMEFYINCTFPFFYAFSFFSVWFYLMRPFNQQKNILSTLFYLNTKERFSYLEKQICLIILLLDPRPRKCHQTNTSHKLILCSFADMHGHILNAFNFRIMLKWNMYDTCRRGLVKVNVRRNRKRWTGNFCIKEKYFFHIGSLM